MYINQVSTSYAWSALECCPECHGKIVVDNAEAACSSCGLVVGTELCGYSDNYRPLGRKVKAGREISADRVDRTWRHIIEDYPTRDNPIPFLSSLFLNPFVGIRIYREHKNRSKAFKRGFDESRIDMRRRNRSIFHGYILRLIERVQDRFSYISRNGKRRKGLFAACLYIEAMIECFEQLKFQAEVLGALRKEIPEDGRTRYFFNVSKRSRKSIRAGLVMPKTLAYWASAFHVSKKTIMKRIREIEQERPSVGRIISFVRHF